MPEWSAPVLVVVAVLVGLLASMGRANWRDKNSK